MTEGDIVAACLGTDMLKRDAVVYALQRRAAGMLVWEAVFGKGKGKRSLIDCIAQLDPERASFLLAKVMVQIP